MPQTFSWAWISKVQGSIGHIYGSRGPIKAPQEPKERSSHGLEEKESTSGQNRRFIDTESGATFNKVEYNLPLYNLS